MRNISNNIYGCLSKDSQLKAGNDIMLSDKKERFKLFLNRKNQHAIFSLPGR